MPCNHNHMYPKSDRSGDFKCSPRLLTTTVQCSPVVNKLTCSRWNGKRNKPLLRAYCTFCVLYAWKKLSLQDYLLAASRWKKVHKVYELSTGVEAEFVLRIKDAETKFRWLQSHIAYEAKALCSQIPSTQPLGCCAVISLTGGGLVLFP